LCFHSELQVTRAFDLNELNRDLDTDIFTGSNVTSFGAKKIAGEEIWKVLTQKFKTSFEKKNVLLFYNFFVLVFCFINKLTQNAFHQTPLGSMT
jgi:hypothetical protein